MHGRKRQTEPPSAEEQAVTKKKMDMYRNLLQVALKGVRDNARSPADMELNGKLLTLNPDISTLWNHRRRCFTDIVEQQMIIIPRSMDAFNTILTQELKLTEAAIAKNTKSYYAWYHRKWCIEHLTELPPTSSLSVPSPSTLPPPTDGHLDPSSLSSSSSPAPDTVSSTTITATVFNPQNEIILCNELLDLDERNFHCWQYRRWITERTGISIDIELQYTFERITKNFSNYSAWHQRSYLLQKKYSCSASSKISSSSPSSSLSSVSSYLIPLPFLTAELDLLRQAMFTEPDDQSPWFYHRWIIYEICKHLSIISLDKDQSMVLSKGREIYSLLSQDCSHLRSLQAIESLSKWPLIALIHSSQLYYQTLHKVQLNPEDISSASSSSTQEGVLSSEEIQTYLTKVETMDQLHMDYYEHLRNR